MDEIYTDGILQVFCSVWKETTGKPFKIAAAKNFFSCMYVIGTICFDECYVINGRHY